MVPLCVLGCVTGSFVVSSPPVDSVFALNLRHHVAPLWHFIASICVVMVMLSVQLL